MNMKAFAAAVLFACLAYPSASLAQAPATSTDTSAELETLRAEVTKAAAEIHVNDADLQLRFPYAPLVAAVAKLNSRPESERTINIQSTAANGKFWEDGATWCHSYLELQGPSDLRGAVVLSRFVATTQSNGSINLSIHADIGAKVQAHWHFMGRRVSGPFGIGNVCPPGGGAGGSIGGHGKTDVDLVMNLNLVQSANGGSLAYILSRVSPDKANMTLSVGFQHIGDLGIPMSFNIPSGQLATGEVAMLFLQRGTFSLPGGEKRSYVASLKPSGFHASQAGVVAGWKSNITFEGATASQ